MSTITLNLNSMGKDMDWTWPIAVNNSYLSDFLTDFQNQDWSDIRTAYQNLNVNEYWVYDDMHPDGICIYEKLPKVSIAGDERVWVPIDFIDTSYSDIPLKGCYVIKYFPTNGGNVDDYIAVHIVDGVFDHAALSSADISPMPQ